MDNNGYDYQGLNDKKPSNGSENTYAVMCLVFGIASLFSLPVLSTISAVLALVFGAKGVKTGPHEYCTIGRIFAIVHLILVGLAVCFIMFCVFIGSVLTSAVDYDDWDYEEPTSIERSLEDYGDYENYNDF